jgi:hypothetical protein
MNPTDENAEQPNTPEPELKIEDLPVDDSPDESDDVIRGGAGRRGNPPRPVDINGDLLPDI